MRITRIYGDAIVSCLLHRNLQNFIKNDYGAKTIIMNEKRKQEYKMIGLNIAYYRKLKGLTQLQLAEQINISRTHMSNIEAPNMPTSISLDTLLDIADILEIPVSNLLYFII